MNRFIFITAVVVLHTSIDAAAVTVYSEKFSNRIKLGNGGATAELENGGSYSLGTWVYFSGHGGVNDSEEGAGYD